MPSTDTTELNSYIKKAREIAPDTAITGTIRVAWRLGKNLRTLTFAFGQLLKLITAGWSKDGEVFVAWRGNYVRFIIRVHHDLRPGPKQSP